MNNVISIKLNEQEKEIINNIEDEYDFKIVKEYKKEKVNGTLELIPFEDLLKEL